MTLGAHLRALREAKRAGDTSFSLRQVAKRVGVEPGYLSRIENDKFEGRPSEQLLVALAKELGEHPDVLLAMAGRVSERLKAIIRKRPKLFAEVIEYLAEQPDHAVLRVVREVRDGDW